jgi:hypothetical protein
MTTNDFEVANTPFQISTVDHEDLVWSFDNYNSITHPTFSSKEGPYTSSVKVDPFPGYAHNADLVKSHAEKVLTDFPIRRLVRFFLPAYEVLERVNGWCRCVRDYDNDQKDEQGRFAWNVSIIFSGKRIPPHPAMTRYLVAHEYGHAVERAIEHRRCIDERNGVLRDEYVKLRASNINPDISYGGRTWHATWSEIFANDFRILVTNTELEFWPHPGFARPEEVPGLKEWWDNEVRLNAEPPIEPITSGEAMVATQT